MTMIYLIRHAEAEGNLYRIAQGQDNSRLTARGWEQVHALSHRFETIPVQAVYASDLYRTCATASAVYRPKNLPLHKDPELREANLGDWEGQPWGEIARRQPEQLLNFTLKPHLWHVNGAESAAEAQTRLLAAVRRIAEENDGKTIAIVSHGYAMRMMLGALQGYPLEKIGESPQEGNTAVSLLKANHGELQVVFRGDTDHLQSLAPAGKKIVFKRSGPLEDGMFYKPFDARRDETLLQEMGGEAWKDAGETRQFDADRLMRDTAHRYTVFGCNGEERPSAVLQMTAPGWISMLFVRRDEREQGLGVQMIGRAIQWTHQQGGEQLQVALRRGSPAGALFTSVGFIPVGKMADERIILEKNLRCEQNYA